MTDIEGKCRGFGFVGFEDHESAQKVSSFIIRNSYCFQRVLAIAILSVRLSIRHTGGSVKNSAV